MSFFSIEKISASLKNVISIKKPCDFGLKTERCSARRGLLPDCDIFDKTGFLKFKDLHIIDDRFSLARKWSRGKVTTEKPCHFIQKCRFWHFDQQVVLRQVSEKLQFQKRSFLRWHHGGGHQAGTALVQDRPQNSRQPLSKPGPQWTGELAHTEMTSCIF